MRKKKHSLLIDVMLVVCKPWDLKKQNVVSARADERLRQEQVWEVR